MALFISLKLTFSPFFNDILSLSFLTNSLFNIASFVLSINELYKISSIFNSINILYSFELIKFF